MLDFDRQSIVDLTSEVKVENPRVTFSLEIDEVDIIGFIVSFGASELANPE